MKKIIIHSSSFILLLFVTLQFSPTLSQTTRKWSFTARVSANSPVKDLGSTAIKTGAGLEGSFAYRFMPHLSAYTGWSWTRFTAKSVKLDFEETGYQFGLQFIHSIANSSTRYILGAGGTNNHIETENDNGDILHNTGHGLGWQFEASILVPLSNRVSLMPGLKYRSLSRDMSNGENANRVYLSYLSGGLALVLGYSDNVEVSFN
jgi:hypothetical protein